MPQEFYREMKLRKWRAISEKAEAAAITGLIIINLVLFMRSAALWISLALCVIIAICVQLKSKTDKIQETAPWCVPVGVRSLEEIAALFQAEALSQDSYAAFGTNQKYRIRLLLFRIDVFETEQASKLRQASNRKINALHAGNPEPAVQDRGHTIRINLAVTEEANEELTAWVRRSEQTLSRKESILNLACLSGSGELLLPRLGKGHPLSELNRYESGLLAVFNQIGSENRKTEKNPTGS